MTTWTMTTTTTTTVRRAGLGRGGRIRPARTVRVSATTSRHDEAGGSGRTKVQRRVALSLGVLGALAASKGSSPEPSLALGPTDVELEIIDYKDIECVQGTPKGARCVEFRAMGNLKSKQPAYNGEIFGKLRYNESGESAIYGDFAEATDAGKIGDIDEVPPGKSELKFVLLLQPGKENEELKFIKPKIRVYPGMRKDFRIMKPVSDTMDVCDPDFDLCD